jgi:DNA-directed RNA polymerase III subunit RPC1
LDGRLGISRKGKTCKTCGEQYDICNGHFGHVKLALPVFHVGYFKMIITILQEICKDCSNILLTEQQRRSFLKDLRRSNIDNLRRTQICKKIQEQCKKTGKCYHCGATNGTVKKAGSHPLRIIHEKYRKFHSSNSKNKERPKTLKEFDESFEIARQTNGEVEKHYKKAVDDMNPVRVLNLFNRISEFDCELLGMDPRDGRPEMFIWQYVPAPPVCIRPSVAQDSASTEDELTTKLSEIVHISTLMREGLSRGAATSQIMEQWDFLQLQVALYINSDVPGLQQGASNKAIRGFCQRLKGKQGRFRGNLSGKRVDFSGRTVISPDPNLAINEVAVPELVAKNLTYPEKVNRYNIEKLRQRIRNGPKVHPGAVHIIKPWGKLGLKFGDREASAQKLRIGETVERHLEDGDIVLFNRQPSLHKLSILSHYVKVRPHRTFRLNECVCNPYNADFDGDEMNLHVPQTEEARIEAMELMGVKHNLATPKNGEPIISAIQDFITASYLLSSKDVFYDRKTFTNICMYMVDGNMQLDLPPPAILKPQMLWTGKQVFNVLMRPNKATQVFVNLDAQCREFKAIKGQPNDLDENDCWLVIRNSEIMCGVMDKSTIGSGKKDSVFYVILRDFGPDAAIQAMSRLAKLSASWLTNQGFSIGISDVYPGGQLVRRKDELVETAYARCDQLIEEFKLGKLEKAAGCDEETTLENKISGLLSDVRQNAGKACVAELSKCNAPLIMAASGSKGSHINVSQMVAAVGQQIIGGKRVDNGFQDRTLPHFPKHAKQPPSKGFVRNSFFSGLTPSEFIFHAMSGREGLVDTAVKTAETGYMSRRLMKSLEDLSSQYDDTVRNSTAGIIQFRYGEDQLDPVNMEGKAKPVNFDRTFMHCETITWNNDDEALMPWEVSEICRQRLDIEREKYTRYSLLNEKLDYVLKNDAEADQLESAREFLDSIENYIEKKVSAQIIARKRLGLSLGASREPAPKRMKTSSRNKKVSSNNEIADAAWNRVHKISEKLLQTFLETCLTKYHRAQVEPGHAVGAVGAQSIGEPGTQMTLKTFHFAGVAGMSITEGVPRIKEIINASKEISTPIITCELATQGVIGARVVKGRIEKTYLKDVSNMACKSWVFTDGFRFLQSKHSVSTSSSRKSVY